MTAQAVYFNGDRTVEIRDEPFRVGKGEVEVQSELIAISHGTEMLVYRGELPSAIELDATIPALGGPCTYPLKYGYSNVGTSQSAGRVFAFYPHQNRFSARPEELIALPDGVPFERAVFLPNIETALTIVQDLQSAAGETVVIVGGRVIGQLVASVLRQAHYGPIALVDPIEARREMCIDCVDASFHPDDPDLPVWVKRRSGAAGAAGAAGAGGAGPGGSGSGGSGADCVIDVSSSESGLQLAIELLRFSGTLVEASWFGARPVTLDLGSAFHRQRITMRSVQVSTIDPRLSGRWSKARRMETACDLLAIIQPERLITHRFGFDDAAKAYELIDKHPEQTLQVVLVP